MRTLSYCSPHGEHGYKSNICPNGNFTIIVPRMGNMDISRTNHPDRSTIKIVPRMGNMDMGHVENMGKVFSHAERRG